MAEHDHEHDPEHDHDHGTLQLAGARVDDAVLAALRETNPPLAENLELTRRWTEATDDEKKRAPELQRAVEHFQGWTPGYHAAGDVCVVCRKAVEPLFYDRFAQGEIPYGAFLSNLPVHATRACLEGFARAMPNLAPRSVDKARREVTRDVSRPSAGMSQFFRHDVLAHPPFALEAWADSVAEANPGGLDKPTMKDIERLLQWVHRRLFHH